MAIDHVLWHLEPTCHLSSMHSTTLRHVPSMAVTRASPTEQTTRKRKREFGHIDDDETRTDVSTIMFEDDECWRSSSPPPSWEVIELITRYMDAKTLAVASCVSKTWSLCFSSNHLWRSLCNTHHPSLSAAVVKPTAVPLPVSYNRLYSMANSAAKRRVKQPSKPKILLSDLIFTVHVSSASSNITLVKEGKDLLIPSEGLFRFNLDVVNQDGSSSLMAADDMKEVKVTWNIVLGEWESIFTMMDGFRSVETDGWFSEELPAPECCPSGSGLAADVKLGFNGDGRRDRTVRIEKMSLGIMNVLKWRYLNVDDGLRYLQHFLLEDNAPRS